LKTQILAIGGAAIPEKLDNLLLLDYFLRQTGKPCPRVCFIGTAHGDNEAGRLRFYSGFSQFNCRPTHLPLFARTPRDLDSFVLENDAIFVGGGNTRSLLAVWRDWGLDLILKKAWQQGIILGGASAGSICWFDHGITDSIDGPLTALKGLGFLAGSNCPHYDSEAQRRPTYQRLVGRGSVSPGWAADDGVGLHFINGELHSAVSSRPKAKAFRIEANKKRAVETAIAVKRLIPPRFAP
jgi:peptidase E